MKKVLVLVVALIALSTGAWANSILTYDVSANGTFLEQTVNDSCANSVMAVPGCQSSYFEPDVIAVIPGETLILTEGGGACYSGFISGVPQGCVNEPLGGVFSSQEDLLASNNQNRVPDQVATTLPNIQDPNFNTYYAANGLYTGTGVNTQIADDFYICGPGTVPDCASTSTTVVVPVGANYLYVGALDSFYADNSSNTNGGLTVTVDAFTTPEPATWTLMLAGLVLTAAFYRRRQFSR